MTKVKDFLSVFKDGVLIAMFLLLIIFPSSFNKMLERAGFTEGSFGGFTWKQKAEQLNEVADSSQQLAANASAQMEQMQDRMNNISQQLEKLAETNYDPAVENIAKAINSSKKELKASNNQLKRRVEFQNKKLKTIFKDGAVVSPN